MRAVSGTVLNPLSRRGIPIDKWTPFWLSLVLPGVGQLVTGHVSGFFWLGGVFVIPGVGVYAEMTSIDFSLSPIMVPLGIAWTLASAEHAKRLCEPRVAGGTSRVTRSRVRNVSSLGDAIDVRIALDVAIDAKTLWQCVADLPRFLTVDPFHETVLLEGPAQQGTRIALLHNVFGIRFRRDSKILRWQPGREYAFSDLSTRDPHRGFPHIFVVSVVPQTANRCQLHVDIRGKWTAPGIPMWAGRIWVRLVCCEHARLLRKAL